MSSWRETFLGDEIELAYGKSLAAHAREPGPFQVFGSNGCIGLHSSALIKGPGIVVGRKGSVGEVVYSIGDFWPIDTTYYVVNKGGHDWRFLLHLLSSLGLEKLNSHSAVPGLNRENVYSITAKLPPKSEQTMIARALDTLQDSLNLETEAIRQSRNLKRATMRALFSAGRRGEAQKDTAIGPIPESWRLIPISGLGRIVTGTTPPTNDLTNYLNGDVPFITPGDIEHGSQIRTTEKRITRGGLVASRSIMEGATCFVCIGSTIGKVGYATSPICATNQQINSIIPREDFDPLFVFHLLTYWAEYVRKQASPSPVPILSKGVFERIEIPTTFNAGEQREISGILDLIDRKIDLSREKHAVFEDLFKTMLRKLMTGDIRVADLELSMLEPKDAEGVAV